MEAFLRPLLPEVLAGRYRLGRLLGQGGSAEVYAAWDERLQTEVAVKVFWDGRGADLEHPGTGQDRRAAEVATLSRLHHPNLVELLDAGVAAGYQFYAMGLADGRSLVDEMRGGPLALPRVAELAAELAAALAYVHGAEVVHRDVKPGNVLLGPGERIRLSDFGISRGVDDTRVTGTGLMIGTAGYFAPEQVTGAHIGPAADIYALGLVLLECLTGRREYDGPGLESALARLHRRPWLPPDLPSGWRGLLEAMTRDDPAERPEAGQVQIAVALLAADPQAELPPLAPAPLTAGAPVPAPAGTRSRRWLAPVLAGALLLPVGAVLAALQLGGARSAPDSFTVLPPIPVPASTAAPRIEFAPAPAPSSAAAPFSLVATGPALAPSRSLAPSPAATRSHPAAPSPSRTPRPSATPAATGSASAAPSAASSTAPSTPSSTATTATTTPTTASPTSSTPPASSPSASAPSASASPAVSSSSSPAASGSPSGSPTGP